MPSIAIPDVAEPQQQSQQQPSPDGDNPSSPETPQHQQQEGHRCQWEECTKVLSDPEALYNHLCHDHIGRKSTNNLCLTCKWKDCGTSCAKRDHITSHLRVHTPLKPHICEVCSKPFKRPQDLKKHEKIHTEEHHAQHKHSKAITVPGRPPLPPLPTPSSHHLRPPPVATHSLSIPHSHQHQHQHHNHYGIPTPSPEMPHPDLDSMQRAEYYAAGKPYPSQGDVYSPTGAPGWHGQQQQQQQQPISPYSATAPTANNLKRSHDYEQQSSNTNTVEEFFADLKKRRVEARYDAEMASRLNAFSHIAEAPAGHAGSNASASQYAHSQSQVQPTPAPLHTSTHPNTIGHAPRPTITTAASPTTQPVHFASHTQHTQHQHQHQHQHQRHNSMPSLFSPHQINVDIRTPEDLAAVNQFLVALGRDVANGASGHPTLRHDEFRIKQEPGGTGAAGLGGGADGLYFDQASLAQWGLTGMPGIDWTVDASLPVPRVGAHMHHHHHAQAHSFAHTQVQVQAQVQAQAQADWDAGDNGRWPLTGSRAGSLPQIYPPAPSIAEYHHPQMHAHLPSTPSASSRERDSPPQEGASPDLSSSGSIDGFGPYLPHSVSRVAVEYESSAQQYHRRGRLLDPPSLAPPEHVAATYRNVPSLRSAGPAPPSASASLSTSTSSSSSSSGGSRYPLTSPLPSIQTVIAASRNRSPSPPPNSGGDSDSSDDALRNLRINPMGRNVENQLPPIRGRPQYPSTSISSSSTTSSPALPPAPSLSPSPEPREFVDSPPEGASKARLGRGGYPSLGGLSSSSSSASISSLSSSPPAPGVSRSGMGGSHYPELPSLTAALRARRNEREMEREKEERERAAHHHLHIRAREDAMDVDEPSPSPRFTSRTVTPTPALLPSEEERLRHAKVVRDLLVLVNTQYRAKFGVDMQTATTTREKVRDAEMAVGA